jgi:TolA-binding protein
MFSVRLLSRGLALALILGLAPASVHAQAFRGQVMQDRGNCSPSRLQLILAAQLQAQQIQGQAYVLGMTAQGNAYQQSMAYPAAIMQQQMMYNQMALMMNSAQYQQQQLQQLTSPPAGAPAAPPPVFGPAGFVDPLMRPAVANPAPPAPAPVRDPAAPVRDPFAKPVVVRDIGPVRDPAPVREIMDPPPVRSKEEEASSKLKLAKLLDRDGFTEKARMRYNEIADKYPGTKAAEEAGALLAKK